jgi:hypothetical protein
VDLGNTDGQKHPPNDDLWEKGHREYMYHIGRADTMLWRLVIEQVGECFKIRSPPMIYIRIE